MNTRHATYSAQTGFGLVELMISMLIGLFLLGGMMTVFITNKQAYRYQQSQGSQHDHERLATVLFGHVLRQTGHTPMNLDALAGKAVALPADTTFATAGQAITGSSGTHSVSYKIKTGTVSETFDNDSVSIRYIGDTGLVSCLGEDVALNETRTETFALSNNVLRCSSSDGTTTETRDLIGDIHAPPEQQLKVLGLRVLYGIDSDGNGSVDLYKRAADVTDWTTISAIDMEITFQAGLRRPQTTHFTTNLPNLNGFI